MWKKAIIWAMMFSGLGSTAAAQEPCQVQGVWMLESRTVDGQMLSSSAKTHIKIVTATHFAWMSQEPGTAKLTSPADSLAAYRTRAFGGGTYRVTATTYTERMEYFYNPEYVGREVTFRCRIEGDRWYHATEWPILQAGREIKSVRLEEVWRRIEDVH